ncbi:multiple sugar transport system substrate-binding protein/putative aldouronate transport system substrate-binding protein [Paenibacillus catalpae]|uniref:Multiple sugar transport system substrate-binding protein/putative aldouronate transport system substrate-binding protein n=1 Tax=Paenibacillus catalpae TaxID=1045775 RepID=A0A1I2E8L4_9BACL|nr:extracellular solute-binding protein [Paenibacillus catalpae]SFE89334.1 multiple sugar transport system substrate-binding protein/putative aldouronate transport system substrate-binding protein [Paenibacillus catalpae]
MKKNMALLLSTALLGVSLTACSSSNDSSNNSQESSSPETSSESPALSGDDLAFSKFPKPVDVHIGMVVDPTDKTLPEGDSVSNNQYTRYLKEKYNINVIVDWTAATGNDFKQKVSLTIASGKLPDGMVVDDRSFMTKAASSGLLYDIGELFDQYASKQVKDIMASTEGRALENASYKGKMVSLPNITVDTDGVHVMWIRKDWLDKLSLPVPKTVADLEKTAKAFIDNKLGGDKTIGIAGPSKNSFPYSTFLVSSNNMAGFDPIFGAMDAYPGYWLDNGDGTVSYGTTSENTKKTLALLADWYKKGLIDPEVGTRDNTGDPINANQTGIFFGPWWAGGYGNGDSFKNDPTANWQAYPVYSDDGKWNTHMKTTGSTYTVISKNAKPDVVKAILIMNNALVRDEATFDLSVAVGWYPLRNVMAAANETEYEYTELMKVLKGEAEPEDYNEPNSLYKLMYADAKKVRDVVKPPFDELGVSNFSTANFGDFQRLYSLLIGDRPFATTPIDKKVYSVTYNQTPTMETKWANLKKMEDETVLKIILGQAQLDSFDKFVKDWKAQGGDEITAEVAELLKK